jgi:CRP/FNR family cyclic AMP-dependent transcriptional regulator
MRPSRRVESVEQWMTTLAGRMMLQRSPLFRGLAPAVQERMAALARQQSYRRGEIVFSHGDSGDALYGVVSGKIRISTGSATGREIFLNIMEPGDTFGEIALLDGGPRTATATAIAPTELVSIRRGPLFELLEREPRAALELLRLAGERLRWTSGLLEDAALLDAPARLAKRLLSLGELHGEAGGGGRKVRISQEELASFLGVSRQSVNEQLQDWKACGWVDLGRGSVTLLDAAALRKAAQG